MANGVEGAHGRREDGSHFSVWECEAGHRQIGDVNAAPARCAECSKTGWRRCDNEEAHAFAVGILGPAALNTGRFTLL